MVNNIQIELEKLKIIDSECTKTIYPTTRDNNLIEVRQCQKSNVIFLSANDYQDDVKYAEKKFTNYWGGGIRNEALKKTYVDDKRRFDQFSELVRGKIYLDFGTGLGGVLDLFKPVAKEIYGIELQEEIRKHLEEDHGYTVFNSIDSIPPDLDFNVISLFHVFEHLSHPLDYLKKIRNKLTSDGKVIIEVPHANDALISLFKVEEFKKFTFWSEHLILHTRNSLEVYLKEAGFKDIVIKGYQRYPLANHLYWMLKGKPGGQIEMNYFQSHGLNTEYADLLNTIDKTDTLIAIAEK